MPQIRCASGHYYDSDRHISCPYCGVKTYLDDETTRLVSPANVDGASDATIRILDSMAGPAGGETVRVIPKALGIDPVVGWLVCVKGAEMGRDYRIKSERNFIGRSPSMDICIEGDDTISRDRHAVITYSPKTATFTLSNGEAHGLMYHNGTEVIAPVKLALYDLIEIGSSRFIFVPLCSERFKWQPRKS